MLGTNDSKPFNWNAHKGEFVGDYEALIDSVRGVAEPPQDLSQPVPARRDQRLPDRRQRHRERGHPRHQAGRGGQGLAHDRRLRGVRRARSRSVALWKPGGSGPPERQGRPGHRRHRLCGAHGGARSTPAWTRAGTRAPKDAANGVDGADAGSSMGDAAATGGNGRHRAGAGRGRQATERRRRERHGGRRGDRVAPDERRRGNPAGNLGAAGTGASPAHTASGGCAVAAGSGASPWASVLGLGLAAFRSLGVRRRRRARLS